MRWSIAVAALMAGTLMMVTPAAAQLRGFVNGAGGVAISINDDLPEGGGASWAMQGEVGVNLSRFAVGAEVGQFKASSDRKVKIFGAFVRLSSFTQGSVRPYLVTGLGAYRTSVADFGSRTSVGASVGPGATFRLGQSPVSFLLEARFHTTFDRQPGLNTQQFLAVLGGAELRF